MSFHSTPVDSRSLDDIYAAAQKESGPLVIAAGGDGRPLTPCISSSEVSLGQSLILHRAAQAQYDALRTAFAQRFPKIELDLTVDFSKYHDSRVDRAIQEDRHIADVCFIQDLHVFPRWNEQNVLLRYKSKTFDDIYPSHKE